MRACVWVGRIPQHLHRSAGRRSRYASEHIRPEENERQDSGGASEREAGAGHASDEGPRGIRNHLPEAEGEEGANAQVDGEPSGKSEHHLTSTMRSLPSALLQALALVDPV